MTRPTITMNVMRRALLLGATAVMIGFTGAIVLSRSNIGPLFGIFVAGPIGTIAGAMWGVAVAARDSDPGRSKTLPGWLFGTGIVTMLYTVFMLNLSARSAVWAAGLEALVFCGIAVLLYRTNIAAALSEPVRRCRPIILAFMLFILATTVFPPVTRPWWGGAAQTMDPSALPRVAFILDERLAASRRVPLLTIHRSALLSAWAAAAALAAAAWLVVAGVHTRKSRRA